MKRFAAIALGTAFLIVAAAPGQNPGKDRPLEGKLKVGDPAPDFKLRTMVGKNEAQLSTSRDKKPVVLVFGSYT